MNSEQYKPPLLLFNRHLQTIYPSVLRKIDCSFYLRERINTADEDFLDLDWARTGSSRLAIISHGLEGNSRRSYAVGMARALNRAGWDALAWNFRSCSGEINRKLRMYHSGTIDDLHQVINHAQNHNYNEIALIGFSMGGNQILIYLGQDQFDIPAIICKAVVFSVPADLKSSAEKLAHWSNKIYMARFIRYLGQKIKAKARMFPGQISADNYHKVKTFKDFDDRYTAPIHGFKDAEDYWARCSSKPFIPRIKVPTLIVDALNDPFLTAQCIPQKECAENKNVILKTPRQGGHVGFVSCYGDCIYWSEAQAIAFLNS
jgi:predicted alpha/beta-fold hydrolase